jgi:hypothetical protein
LAASREQRENEKKSSPHPPNPKLKRKWHQGTLSACWAFPLATWNFYFQNCLSPFLVWANTPIINWGYLLNSLVLRPYPELSFYNNKTKMVPPHVRERLWNHVVFVCSLKC